MTTYALSDFEIGDRIVLVDRMPMAMRGYKWGTVVKVGTAGVIVKLDGLHRTMPVRPQNIQSRMRPVPAERSASLAQKCRINACTSLINAKRSAILARTDRTRPVWPDDAYALLGLVIDHMSAAYWQTDPHLRLGCLRRAERVAQEVASLETGQLPPLPFDPWTCDA